MNKIKSVFWFIWHWRLFSLAIVALVAALILYFSGFHTAANITLAVVSLFEVVPLLWGMLADIRSGSYGIDILAATAIVASVLLGQYWAAIIVVIMLTGGESLEDYADHRALSELRSLLDNAPTKAHLIKNKKQVDIKASELKVGDRFIVKPGELVPTDGEIIDGTSTFDESSLTGESVPVSKTNGEKLLSGSINLDGPVTVRATAIAKDSQYQQIVKLVESASASKSPFVRLADRYSIPFTVLAYAIAIAVWVISGHAIRFLEVIIVATPCPLLLAAPIALISGMSRASRYGIIVKTGAALEKLAEAETIAFDKTGTLTSGQLTVDEIKSFGNFKQQDVLSYAASLEQFSNHIIAKAITTKATRGKFKTVKVKGLEEVAGLGLKANFKSQKLIVGRLSLLESESVDIPGKLLTTKQSSTIVYVGLDEKLVGYITLKDQVRKDSKSTLNTLRKYGIKNFMLVTGDNSRVAQKVANELGIDFVIADAMPADKLRAIEKVKERPVIFVGDGVNDAPVLTASDVGIALGARGSTAASESADMVILPDDIGHVASAYSIARRTFKIAQQSIIIGIALSVVLMLIFATGHFKPIYGAVLQEVVDVFVIFNALRAHAIKLS
ncbi:MAG: heavy metal translocating P-type ATPase [Candidatus Saccharibacteria bacterium]